MSAATFVFIDDGQWWSPWKWYGFKEDDAKEGSADAEQHSKAGECATGTSTGVMTTVCSGLMSTVVMPHSWGRGGGESEVVAEAVVAAIGASSEVVIAGC